MFYAAGPPCQPWARGGKALGEEDPRAALFDQSIRLIGTSRPLAFFLEESDKVPSYQQGRWWRHRVEELTAYGYRVHWAIYNASQHGLPPEPPTPVGRGHQEGHPWRRGRGSVVWNRYQRNSAYPWRTFLSPGRRATRRRGCLRDGLLLRTS